MKIKAVTATNFGSYARLDFNFANQGLALIQGPTGAGKSTLCDLIPWCLFGVTAKNGKADEILQWPGDKVAKAQIDLDNISICRTRGPNAKDNDLFIISPETGITRGKDSTDTQKLINHALGMDAALYLSAAYYHELGRASNFFTAPAKHRRELIEQLVDLSFAKELQLKTTSAKKTTETQVSDASQRLTNFTTRIEMAVSRIAGLKRSYDASEINLIFQREEQKAKSDNFEANKQKNITAGKELLAAHLKTHDTPSQETLAAQKVALQQRLKSISKEACHECGQSVDGDEKIDILNEINIVSAYAHIEQTYQTKRANLESAIKSMEAQTNSYQVAMVGNPFKEQIEDAKASLDTHVTQAEAVRAELIPSKSRLQSLETLAGVLETLRATTIADTVSQLQTRTNEYLAAHFDSEIRVDFAVADADKIEVEIYKDGNLCSYTQLSKGQRQLLRLCFGVSTMKTVTERHALDINVAFIDEGFDGLSDELKTKAYSLLQALATDYSSLFVVEHSEALKSLFEKSFKVELTEAGSVITEA